MKQLYFSALFLFSAIFLQPVFGQPVFPGDWSVKVRIEIDSDKINSTLSDFPVAVILDNTNFNFNTAQADGSDVRFTAADETTLLTFERELHDNTGEQAVYWVKIPSVSSSANTVFYLYYGNSEASDASSTDGSVYTGGNRGAVLHMQHEEEEGDWYLFDSRFTNEGEKVSETSPSQVPGLIGYAQEFDGLNDLVTIRHTGSAPSLNISAALTLSAWVKPEKETMILDTVPDAVAAYSLRKLRDGYTGNAIRVRRSSDNDERDIGFSDDHLDVDALETFVGSGNDGFVVTWYDQGSNGEDVTQSTTGNQPMIVENGSVLISNGRPMVRFNNDFLAGTVDMGSQNPDATLNAVWRQDSDGQSEVPVFIGEKASQEGLSIGYFYFVQAFPPSTFRWNNIRLWEWDFIDISGFSTNLRVQTGTYLNNGTSSEMRVFIDGTASSLKTDANALNVGTGYATTPITIGANEDGTDYLQNAYVAEIIIYNKVLDSDERLAMELNQQKCYGFVTPVIAGKGRAAYQLEICSQEFRAYINNQVITAPATFGQYQHVVMTYDQTNLKLYVDGSEVATKAVSGTIGTNTDDVLMGLNYLGEIDEFRVANIARPADRILADYHTGINELLSFDLSGFFVEHPGSQIENVEFNLVISNARDGSGDLLSGSVNVTVTSDQADGEVHNQSVTFTDGGATVPVTLETVATHDLTVEVAGITNPVIVEDVEVLEDIDLSGFNLSKSPPGEQTAGVSFTLLISGATGITGDLLEDGNYNVTIESSEEGELFNGSRFFQDGATQRSLTLFVAAEHTLTVTIDGITEPETIIVQVNAAALSNIAFITDERSITAGGTSDLITIQLQDAYGNEVPSDGGTTINLDSDLAGTFRNVADDADITFVTIPDESSGASFRYTSTVVGTHELSATDAATEDPLTGDTQNLTVNPAAPVAIVYTTDERTITAGESSDIITVQLQDEYGNAAFSSGTTTVNLTSDLTGTFRDEDDEDVITSVTISDGESEANFRYTSIVVGIHELSAADAATEDPLDGDTQNLTVNPAAPAAIVFTTVERTITAGGTSDIITVQLQDEFGNEAFSSGTTTVNLSSDLAGTFRDEDDTGDITFIEIADEESEASFRYTSNVAGVHELSADDAATEDPLEGDTQNLEVEPAAPAAIVFTTAERTITAGETSDIITIQLQDDYGNEAFSSGTTTVNLTSDLTGTFRDEDDTGDITFVEIADEESEASFKYTSTVAGIHELSADNDAKSLTGGTQDLTVDPDAPDKIVFITEEQIVQINQASEIITVQLQDQYDNIAFSDGVTTIDLESDLAGNFRDVDNTVTITDIEIADQESEAGFRFRPTAEGTHTLSADDAAVVDPLPGDTQELIAIDVYIFIQTGDWNDEENWEGEVVPPENSRVIIIQDAIAEISDQITILYLEIQDDGEVDVRSTGASLTVKDSGRATIEPGGFIRVRSGTTFIIADGGQLVIQAQGEMTSLGTLTNNAGADGLIIESGAGSTGSLQVANIGVAATVQRYVTADNWHVVGVPVSGMTIGEFLTGNDEENDIFYNSSQDVHAMTHYDEETLPNGTWAPYYGPADHSTELQPGRSYLIRKRDDGVLTFRGELVPSISGLAIPRTVSGWHSLGNPFSSALRIKGTDHFLDHNSANLDPSYAVLYIYDPANPSIYSIISNSGAIPGPSRPEITQSNIQSGQGFLVRANDGSSTIDFTAGMRAHTTGATFYKKSIGGEEEEEPEEYWPTLILSVSNESKEAFTTITFNENMTTGLDVTYDAGLLGGDRAFKLYTRLVEDDNGVNFAIQCLPDQSPDNLVIPVGFDFSAGGQVRFSTDVFVLPDGAKAYLEDRLLEIFVDLGEDDYIVDLPAETTGTGRFFVHVDFQVTSAREIMKPGVEVLDIYSYGNEVFIRGSVEPETEAVVYDLMGRKLRIVRLEPAAMNSFMMEGHSSGVYLIHVTGNGIHQTKRVYIE